MGAFSDILSDLFGSATGGRFRGGGARTKPQAERGRDLETEVSISFSQAVAGAQVPVAVSTAAPCPTCRGTGAEPGTEPIVCPVCQGRGVESQGQGLFSITRPCARCNGSGTVIEKPCHTCHGEGRQRELKRYRVNIPAGVRDGSRIRLAGKGEAGLRGGPSGDLYVVTRVSESPVFRPKGDNLEVEIPITVVEALRGAEVEVPTLDGTKTLRVKPGTRHGTVQRLRGQGPPRLDGSGRGDIHYRFVIEVPESLNDEQRGLITPKRSPKGTRLYSQADVERLRKIQQMTAELGMNLAGVEKVLELEEQLERMGRRVELLERRAERMQREMEERLEAVRRSYKAEIVRYEPPGTALIHVRMRSRRSS
jgi:molecular chaperone DnaJ